jgi:hypothetical protein
MRKLAAGFLVGPILALGRSLPRWVAAAAERATSASSILSLSATCSNWSVTRCARWRPCAACAAGE